MPATPASAENFGKSYVFHIDFRKTISKVKVWVLAGKLAGM
jgi:hypothetical protein